MNDLSIQSCSLFKEFLQPQRDEDNVILKEMVQSFVEEQHVSMLNDIDNISNNNLSQHNREIDNTCGPTPPPDKHQELTSLPDHDDASFMSYSSFSIPPPSSLPSQPPLQPLISSQENLSDASDITSSSFSSAIPVTIQDFQLIKVIGRGCMGKVSCCYYIAPFLIYTSESAQSF